MRSNLLHFWHSKSMLLKIIIVNIAVFLAIRLIGIAAMIGGFSIDRVIDRLALSSVLAYFLRQPWTLITYMFTHYDVFHILFNLLTLYWFGTMFLFRCTPKQLMGLYLYGGIFGGILYLGCAQVFPTLYGTLLGASAAVMAIVIASAVLLPDYEIRLFLFGLVKLKWVAIVAAVLFALGLTGNNPGGHVAHIGGMITGLWFGLRMNRGRDITAPLNRLIDRIVNLFKAKSSLKGSKKDLGRKAQRKSSASSADTTADTAELDAILDKIKQSGYSSLTPDEKRRLFDVSSRIHN